MKRIHFKPTALVFILALFVSLVTAMDKKRLTGRYRQSNQGTNCFPLTTVPESCTTTNTGIICTTPFGAFTRTWYIDACVTPYYEWP